MCYHATALHLASGRGHVSTVSRLLRYGAEPNVVTDDGQTPLHWAASMGQSKVVRLLIASGADAGIETLNGSITALQIAVANGHSLLAEELRVAAGELELLSGSFSAEDVLDVIFSEFCIGK